MCFCAPIWQDIQAISEKRVDWQNSKCVTKLFCLIKFKATAADYEIIRMITNIISKAVQYNYGKREN